jgi:hypothetical protein
VALELLLEAAAVEEAGQRIVVDQVLEALLEAAAVRDVLDLAEDVARPAVGIAHERRVHGDPHRVALGVQVALLGAVAVDPPRDQVGAAVGVGGGVSS